MDNPYRVYMMILDCPGITKGTISKLLGRGSKSGWLDSALLKVEERYGLLSEDDNGGLYVWEGVR